MHSDFQVPCMFDEAVILQQLRYTGMLETVRIRQSGYSVRLAFEEFIQRFVRSMDLSIPDPSEIGESSIVT